MRFFEQVIEAPPDPILGLNTAFANDPRPFKVNLGVGSYKTAELHPFVLSSVRQAEEAMLQEELDKEYLPIDGDPMFRKASQELVFGKQAEQKCLYAAQTVGGEGGLRIGSEFLLRQGLKTIYIPDPTWPNHKPTFIAAGLEVETYPYYDKVQHRFDLKEMCRAITHMPAKSIILLQGCCHNPTGCDPTKAEWEELASTIRKHDLLPFFDFAYQGFGTDIVEDSWTIRYFLEQFEELLVVNSFSKNFGLYAERVGTLFILANETKKMQKIASQIKPVIRANYSNPPCHGARIVSTILTRPPLKHLWEVELKLMRERIMEMRKALGAGLHAKGASVDFSFLNHQYGMFSFCGLNQDQVERLKLEYGIYMPGNGRINVAGLTWDNLDYVIDAIIAVL